MISLVRQSEVEAGVDCYRTGERRNVNVELNARQYRTERGSAGRQSQLGYQPITEPSAVAPDPKVNFR